MFNNDTKFNTVQGIYTITADKCKLLFANLPIKLLSTELLCNEILADLPYRLVRTERLTLFDTRLLPIIGLFDSGCPISAVIVYSFEGGECRFMSSGEYSASSYAAPVLDLLYRGEIDAGQIVTVRSPIGKRSVATGSGAVIFP